MQDIEINSYVISADIVLPVCKLNMKKIWGKIFLLSHDVVLVNGLMEWYACSGDSSLITQISWINNQFDASLSKCLNIKCRFVFTQLCLYLTGSLA